MEGDFKGQSKKNTSKKHTSKKHTSNIISSRLMESINDNVSIDAFEKYTGISKALMQQMEISSRFIDELNKTSTLQEQMYRNFDPQIIGEASRYLDNEIKSHHLFTAYQIPTIELANNIYQSIESLLSPSNEVMRGILDQITPDPNLLSRYTQPIEKILEQFPPINLSIESQMAEIIKLSVLTQATALQFNWENIGNALEILPPIQNKLINTCFDFGKSYEELYKSWEKHVNLINELPLGLSKLPTIEYYNTIDLIDSITIRQEEISEYTEEINNTKVEIKEETSNRLEELLIKINPNLLIPLRGARDSLVGENPDLVRHLNASLRELFTHVLHSLAEDIKLKAWTTNPEDYDEKGRPTRRARLLYIYRNVKQEPLKTFVDKDVDTWLEFFNIFQKGTHELDSQFNDNQLRALLVRSESMLRFLCEIGLME